jgi:hypothetical protein
VHDPAYYHGLLGSCLATESGLDYSIALVDKETTTTRSNLIDKMSTGVMIVEVRQEADDIPTVNQAVTISQKPKRFTSKVVRAHIDLTVLHLLQ